MNRSENEEQAELEEFLKRCRLPENEFSRAGQKRRDERFYKYGTDMVTDAIAIPIFDKIVAPALTDFERVNKGLFVKQINKEMFHVIRFKQGRTYYFFDWGVSLAFVPHSWSDRCKFHRTLKSARCDVYLYEDELIPRDEESKYFRYNAMDMMHGAGGFTEDLIRGWPKLEPAVRAWLASVTNLDQVLAHAKYQVEVYSESTHSELMYAFVLARVGRFDEGLKLLNGLTQRSSFYSSPDLVRALGDVAKLSA